MEGFVENAQDLRLWPSRGEARPFINQKKLFHHKALESDGQ
ncbi:hypothetical protein CsSME_00036314 [Camellia sinensis var. sinensis]